MIQQIERRGGKGEKNRGKERKREGGRGTKGADVWEEQVKNGRDGAGRTKEN